MLFLAEIKSTYVHAVRWRGDGPRTTVRNRLVDPNEGIDSLIILT